MAIKVYRKLNDTLPNVVATISTGAPVPAGTTGVMKMVAPSGAVVHAAAPLTIDVVANTATYELVDGDLSERGVYKLEMTLSVAPFGKKQTLPRQGYFLIEVDGKL